MIDPSLDNLYWASFLSHIQLYLTNEKWKVIDELNSSWITSECLLMNLIHLEQDKNIIENI